MVAVNAFGGGGVTGQPRYPAWAFSGQQHTQGETQTRGKADPFLKPRNESPQSTGGVDRAPGGRSRSEPQGYGAGTTDASEGWERSRRKVTEPGPCPREGPSLRVECSEVEFKTRQQRPKETRSLGPGVMGRREWLLMSLEFVGAGGKRLNTVTAAQP